MDLFQGNIVGNIVGVSSLLAVVDDLLAHGGTLCVLQKGDRPAGLFDLLEVGFVVGAV